MSSAPAPTPEPAPPPRPGSSGPQQPQQPTRPWWRPPGWMILVALALFALNYWAGSRATQASARPRSVQPVLHPAGQDGNVTEITSKGTAIQGKFKKTESETAQADDALPDRDPGLCGHEGALAAARAESVVLNAEAADGARLVAEPVLRLRPDAPLHRPARSC